jgi:solute carrier family 35 (UDP-xylose/UDP-N-acetylglucosamine transporter), member B4
MQKGSLATLGSSASAIHRENMSSNSSSTISISTNKSKSDINVLALVTSLSLILIGCVANNVVLEIIVSKKANPYADPGAGGLLTFLQFLFVFLVNIGEVITWKSSSAQIAEKATNVSGKGLSTELCENSSQPLRGFLSFLPFTIRTPQVPIKHYAQMTLLFFSMSYLNNWAFQFNISQPLHMVFRSANLATTLIMGYLFFQRKYSLAQVFCVVLLTLGAASATIAEAFSGDTAKAASCAGGGCGDAAAPATTALLHEAATRASAMSAASSWFMFVWCIGIAMLLAVLIIQTCLGQYQSWVAEAYGKAPNEGMFYMHFLSMPGFFLTLPDMYAHAVQWSSTPSTGIILQAALAKAAAPGQSKLGYIWALFAYGATTPIHRLPILWTYVLVNVVTQFVCIKGVYQLTPIADPLTVNVTLTVRKFVSLMVSIVLFNNTFTLAHWIGATCVFGGALYYGTLPAPQKIPIVPPIKHETKKEIVDDIFVNNNEKSGASDSAGTEPTNKSGIEKDPLHHRGNHK